MIMYYIHDNVQMYMMENKKFKMCGEDWMVSTFITQTQRVRNVRVYRWFLLKIYTVYISYNVYVLELFKQSYDKFFM